MSLLPLHISALRDDVRDHLKITSRVTVREGDSIEVGETFTTRFEVTNRFEPTPHDGPGRFTDVALVLEPTPLAELIEPAGPIAVTNALEPGASAAIELRFRALQALRNVMGIDLSEPYVFARVEATFDIASFFRVAQRSVEATQINDAEVSVR